MKQVSFLISALSRIVVVRRPVRKPFFPAQLLARIRAVGRKVLLST